MVQVRSSFANTSLQAGLGAVGSRGEMRSQLASRTKFVILKFDSFVSYIEKPSWWREVTVMYRRPAAAMSTHSSALNFSGLNRSASWA